MSKTQINVCQYRCITIHTTMCTCCAMINIKSILIPGLIVYVIPPMPIYQFNFIVVFNFTFTAPLTTNGADPMTAPGASIVYSSLLEVTKSNPVDPFVSQ